MKRRRYLLVCCALLFLSISPKAYAQDEPSMFRETLSVKIEDDTIYVRASPRSITRTNPQNTRLRTVPDSIVSRMKSDKDFEYANDPSFWKKETPPEDNAFLKALDWLSRSTLVRWILYLFLAAVLIFTLYQIMVVNNFFVFSRKKKTAAADKEEEIDERSSNLDYLLSNAISGGDYRLATRILYLQTLQFLNERQLIRMNAKATNRDYIDEMRKSTGASEFRQLTRIYEYAWYGEYPLSTEQFGYIQDYFKKFRNLH